MTFRDCVAADINNVFINTDEFADTHTWDGNPLGCVVDDDSMIREYSSEFELLPKGSHLIYAAADSFAAKPKVGAVVRFDNSIYTVDEISEEMGMYVIFLARGRG